ncbi:hypothetical protein BCEN4_740071 [Burkholderia cenocepacia]|uniref:hypothetical protein n=1 Tax=Burkholderia cenocepacia TaxID=95486 RepID=UPI00192C9153|nr:hypothetical protein [Burkholderia cenocepacia]CAD9227941.1 hypothetical protein BCEN4_740071 [Burkholderia cenocepacia]
MQLNLTKRIEDSLETLAKVWNIREFKIHSKVHEDKASYQLIDVKSNTIAKSYTGTLRTIVEDITDDIHRIVWQDQEDYTPAMGTALN